MARQNPCVNKSRPKFGFREYLACTKTQNNKTKRPKRNERNYQKETSETIKTKTPKRPKRNHRNERKHRNDQNETAATIETTETKSPKPAKPRKRAKGNAVTPKRRLYRPCRTEYYLLFFGEIHQERQSTFASILTSVLSLGRLSGHLLSFITLIIIRSHFKRGLSEPAETTETQAKLRKMEVSFLTYDVLKASETKICASTSLFLPAYPGRLTPLPYRY